MAKPEHHWDFLDMGVVSRLSRLSVTVRLPMLGSVTGMHRSATRGSSVEFAEYRKYAPGDDLKNLDWRVFGRTDRFYIKEFEADTNLRCYIVLDTSASMQFGGASGTRFDYARSVAGTLAHLLINQGDAVGLVCASAAGTLDLPPRRTPSHLRQILDTLATTKPQGETNLVSALHGLAERISQRSLVIVISDLFAEPQELLECFKHLRFYKHDAAVFHLLDRQEFDFNFQRPVRFVDLETGAEVITDPALVRDAYRESLDHFLSALLHGCREFQVDYRLNYLNDGYEGVLGDFLMERIKRMKGRSR